MHNHIQSLQLHIVFDCTPRVHHCHPDSCQSLPKSKQIWNFLPKHNLGKKLCQIHLKESQMIPKNLSKLIFGKEHYVMTRFIINRLRKSSKKIICTHFYPYNIYNTLSAALLSLLCRRICTTNTTAAHAPGTNLHNKPPTNAPTPCT